MDMATPLVSIGLPVYNGENYLEETLNSILVQTWRDFEVIISDNASNDRTATICREYATKDQRIRYYRNETNIGANQNYNRTVELARGTYFKWAPHDDLLAPTFLARCVEALERDPAAVLAYSQVVLIDADGDPLQFDEMRDCFIDKAGNIFRKLDRSRRLDSMQPNQRYEEILVGTRWCFEIFGLIRTAVLRRTSILDTYYGSDKVLLAQLSLKGHFIEIPEPLLLNRRHPSQSASLTSAQAREAWSNPLKAKRLKSPRLLCLQGYFNAIFGAELQWDEQLRCLIILARWLVRSDNWQRFFSDLYINHRKSSPSVPQTSSSTSVPTTKHRN